jgi:hypothetical protein
MKPHLFILHPKSVFCALFSSSLLPGTFCFFLNVVIFVLFFPLFLFYCIFLFLRLYRVAIDFLSVMLRVLSLPFDLGNCSIALLLYIYILYFIIWNNFWINIWIKPQIRIGLHICVQFLYYWNFPKLFAVLWMNLYAVTQLQCTEKPLHISSELFCFLHCIYIVLY